MFTSLSVTLSADKFATVFTGAQMSGPMDMVAQMSGPKNVVLAGGDGATAVAKRIQLVDVTCATYIPQPGTLSVTLDRAHLSVDVTPPSGTARAARIAEHAAEG